MPITIRARPSYDRVAASEMAIVQLRRIVGAGAAAAACTAAWSRQPPSSSSTTHEGAATASAHAAPAPTTLFGAWFCPYVQRAWIALEEKQVPYRWIEINPYEDGEFGKATKKALSLEEKRRRYPDFVAASPLGLVPAMRHEDDTLAGSMVCVEFIDEQWSDTVPLLPAKPTDRAHVRQWATYANDKIIPFYYRMLMAQDAAGREEAKRSAIAGLAEWTGAMHEGGDYFLGAQFSYADVAIFPWVDRFLTVGAAYRGFALPDTQQFERLKRWHAACKRRPSVARTLADEELLVANYAGCALPRWRSNAGT